MLPILLVVISKEKYYKSFYKIAHNWGKVILFGTGFWSEVKTLQKIEKDKSYMFIANHTSMIDIMLMLSVVKNPCVFVGKEELTKIPLFGYIFKRTSITVNRGNSRSRKAVFDEAQKRLSGYPHYYNVFSLQKIVYGDNAQNRGCSFYSQRNCSKRVVENYRGSKRKRLFLLSRSAGSCSRSDYSQVSQAYSRRTRENIGTRTGYFAFDLFSENSQRNCR